MMNLPLNLSQARNEFLLIWLQANANLLAVAPSQIQRDICMERRDDLEREILKRMMPKTSGYAETILLEEVDKMKNWTPAAENVNAESDLNA